MIGRKEERSVIDLIRSSTSVMSLHRTAHNVTGFSCVAVAQGIVLLGLNSKESYLSRV